MAYIDQFLSIVVAEGGSDLHIGEGQPPKMRRYGDVSPIREEPVTRVEAAGMLSEICGARGWELFEERGDLDFAYEMDELSRFRCNFLKQTNGIRKTRFRCSGQRQSLRGSIKGSRDREGDVLVVECEPRLGEARITVVRLECAHRRSRMAERRQRMARRTAVDAGARAPHVSIPAAAGVSPAAQSAGAGHPALG